LEYHKCKLIFLWFALLASFLSSPACQIYLFILILNAELCVGTLQLNSPFCLFDFPCRCGASQLFWLSAVLQRI